MMVFQARKFWGGRIVTKFFEKLNKFIKGKYNEQMKIIFLNLNC
jgi:hypothetical protein